MAALLALGCSNSPAPGEWRALRYFAEVPGLAPLRLVPPIADRSGNLYVLHGDATRFEVLAFVGFASGGWSEGCHLQKGSSRGVHGWVGHGETRAWYWAGDALVEMSGAHGGCRLVLDRDPTSQADLRFAGIFPWIEDSPSVTRARALVYSVGDAVPFHVVVDLDLGRTTHAVRCAGIVSRIGIIPQ